MAFTQFVCTNDECSEKDLPKGNPMGIELPVYCGGCGEPVAGIQEPGVQQ